MGWFGKDKLDLAEIAKEITLLLTQSIMDDALQGMSEWGIDRIAGEHKREILILGLYALRVSAPSALGQMKAVALVDYTQQHVKHLYINVIKGDSRDYDVVLQQRHRAYDEIFTSHLPEEMKLEGIGRQFANNLGLAHPALHLWAAQMFVGWAQANRNFLKRMNEKFDLHA